MPLTLNFLVTAGMRPPAFIPLRALNISLPASLSPQVLKGHRDEVCALLLTPASAPGGAGGRLISGSRDAAVHVWDMRVEPAAAKTCSLGGIR